MRRRTVSLIKLFLLLLVCSGMPAAAQEASENITQAQTYLEQRTTSLEKYLKRSERIQQRLLRQLKRKEDKMLRKLAAKDSALYYQYTAGRNISYDSIARLSADSSYQHRQSLTKNAIVDSLKGVQQFIQQQNSKLQQVTGLADKAGINLPYSKDMAGLQQQLNSQADVNALIGQRTQALEQLGGKANIKGLQGIQQKVYYAGEKIKAWKRLADEPDDAEEEALEYLQGTEGFAESLKGSSGNNAFGGLGNNASAEDLQRMGFQTKSQVTGMLQQKLGNSMQGVQQQLAGQVKDYTEKLGDISGKVKEAQDGLGKVKQTANEAKQAKNNLQHLEKPAFHKNPERGKPFWQRLEPQYNFQTTRATPDGLRPAMLEFGAGVAFKHTPKLSYGVGISLSAGLGQNWQNIRLSYEGVSARVYADWKLLYGFSAQAGYERIFRPANRPYLPGNTNADSSSNNNNANNSNNIFHQAFGGMQQAAYIGIMKRYRINSTWNGTFLAGYNFLWQQEGMRSPWMLRFGWGGK